LRTQRAVHFAACIADIGPGIDLWQQPGAGLRHHFALGLILGLGGGEVGVVGQGVLIDGQQVGPVGCLRRFGPGTMGDGGDGNSQ